jgi:hypothetical protein
VIQCLPQNPTPSTTGLITEEQFESIIEGLQLDADATLVFYDDDASMVCPVIIDCCWHCSADV